MNRKRANAMYRARCRALLFPLALLLVCSPPDLETSGSEITKMEHEFWVTLYHEVHPGEFPNWSKYGGRHAWAREETERLEPVVVQILRGEREETPWRHGLFVARDMPTERVCNALFTRMQSILREVAGRATGFTASDHASLVGVVSVLAEGGDARAVAPVNKLIQSPECSYRVAYKYLMALRKVGTAESLEALRRMPLRKSNERIDRMAALTEKIINARLRGITVSPDAQKELRDLAKRFLRAAKTQDYGGYIGCLPFGFQEVVDEGNMREFLERPDGGLGLAALSRTLDDGKPFDVHLGNLRATLTCEERYQLECVLEVDGWKVANLRLLPPHQVRPD